MIVKNFDLTDVPRNTKQFYNHRSFFVKKELEKSDYVKTRDSFVDAIFNMKKSNS